MAEQWWVIHGGEDKMRAITETPDGSSGALAYVGRQSRDIDADAQLIAAAPELLQACSYAEEVIRTASDGVVKSIRASEEYAVWAELRMQLEEALAKARREEGKDD